jgi:hypothetical protein
MTLFGPPKNEDYPRKWKDMSLEYKLMFGFHICMMVLFATQGISNKLTEKQQILFVIAIAAAILVLSVRHRRAIRWKWQGVAIKDVAWAAVTVVLGGVFFYSASSWFSPLNPRFLPWYLAGLGIAIFNTLNALKLVRTSEAQMMADAQRGSTSPESHADPEPFEPVWRRAVRAIYYCVFFLVWLAGVGSFYLSGKTYRSGSPSPTVTQTEPMSEHGSTVYITRMQKLEVDELQTISFIGIPVILASGFILHFLTGVKLFPNTPTLAEWRAKRAAQN